MRCVCLRCSLFLLQGLDQEGVVRGQTAVRRVEQELQRVQRDVLRRAARQLQEQQRQQDERSVSLEAQQ